VYCGLAAADLNGAGPGSATGLTVAVVDDAGRLLDTCDLSDDAAGFAELGALLADRANGLESVAVAADSDEHIITQLLTAAGRYLAYTDGDSADDYAERFGDDESADEIHSSPAERRAVGLARALQAGVLSAVAQATPRDLLGLKPVLAAHAAVTNGRHGAAATLREVLRELYPAALRAFPDPAEAIPLAILDALPEPGPFGGPTGRGRDTQAIAELTAAGVAEAGTVTDAVTALRVAIAETPRRAGMNRSITSAVAETVRQAVAAVRACDAASSALVSVLAARMPSAAPPVDVRSTRSRRGNAAQAPGLQSLSTGNASAAVRPRSAAPAATPEPDILTAGVAPTVASVPATAPFAHPPQPMSAATPSAPAPAGYAASAGAHRRARGGDQEAPPVQIEHRAMPTPIPVHGPRTPIPVQAPPAPIPLPPAASVPTPVHPPLPTRVPAPSVSRSRPVVAVPPPGLSPATPPGLAPTSSAPGMTRPAPPPGLTPAAAMPTVNGGRPSADLPPPGSRATWPLTSEPARDAGQGHRTAEPRTYGSPAPAYGSAAPAHQADALRMPGGEPADGSGRINSLSGMIDPVRPSGTELPRQREGRVMPPWQSDDLPAEPPALRLVEPAPLADPALAGSALAGSALAGSALADPALANRGLAPPPEPDIRRPAERLPERQPTGRSDDEGRGDQSRVEDRRFDERHPDERRLSERPPEYGDEFDGRLRFEQRALRLVETNGALNGLGSADRGGADGGLSNGGLSNGGFPTGGFPSGGVPNGSAERIAPNNGAERIARRTPQRRPDAEVSEQPSGDESDGDLLIFAEARSAWFTDHFGEEDVKLEFTNPSDAGWRAAEQVAERADNIETSASLPRRVPQQNLVPGSPVAAPERPLRIVRDPAIIANHMTGYFRGWRRGQEAGGYRAAGRQAREAAGWDFSGSGDQGDDGRDYEYRSARR
jgi:hypothetical protein